MNQPMNPNKQMVALTPEEAQLLKAAPRMYEELKWIAEHLGWDSYHKRAIKELLSKVDKGD